MDNLEEKGHSKNGLRVVSLFEAAKGLLVLLTGFGLLALIHKDLHLAAEQLVRHFHLNPASHYPRIFIDLANHLNAGKLWGMAFAALIYSVVRFIEAFGLWMGQQWAKWFGLLTAGLYVPIELFEVIRGATWPKLTVFIVNVGIVGYLACVLYQSRLNSKRAMK